MADLDKAWRSPRPPPILDPLQVLLDEIDVMNRKRVFKQVPNEPSGFGRFAHGEMAGGALTALGRIGVGLKRRI
jgi:hypothetical protein